MRNSTMNVHPLCCARRVCVFFTQGDTVYETVVPEIDEKELEKMVNPIVQEYFEHGDTKEVQVSNYNKAFEVCAC